MYPRFIERRLRAALEESRVVLLNGPRQSGKTTLARAVAQTDAPFLTLDDATVLDAARRDPVGFVRGLDAAVIDEVQRVPELMLAIKTRVDEDPRPGRFLLTGSANLMALPRVADSLAGRMETITLAPLAQAELRRKSPPPFIETLFSGEAPASGDGTVGDDLVSLVLSGGYPEAVRRRSLERRQDWLLDYVDAIIQRDIRDFAQIEQLNQMPRLLKVMAQHSGQIVNYSGLGAPLDMNHVTTRRYADLFESVFLVRTLPPWSGNRLSRLTKTPKLHLVDSGLLAALTDAAPERLARDRTAFGALLETFVLGEVSKLASWSGRRYALSHFRDKDRNEVDIVIEDRRGDVVGIEVKASATVKGSDFKGLNKLAEVVGDRFRFGAVLYDHDLVVPQNERMAAIPLATLWS